MIQKHFFLNLFLRRKKIKVEPFLAFGNDQKIFVKGRVITANKPPKPSSRNSIFRNILDTIRRYAIISIPDAEIEVTHQDQRYLTRTDENGVFELQIEAKKPDGDRVEVLCFKIITAKEGVMPALRFMEVTRYDAATVIISDVDDTVLISHSTQIGKKFWLSISKNSINRRPLPGVSKFYKKLSQFGKNPIFYVSSSDWSLFDLISDFLRFRKLPLGPILLKDAHINLSNIFKSGQGSHSHKLDKILLLLEFYPLTKFVLIGDSGQQDPEIYASIIEKFPDRILGVFIRLVGNLEGQRKIELEKTIVMDRFFFINTSKEAIEIAEKEGFIN